MRRDMWNKEVIENAQLSPEEMLSIVKQLTQMIYFAPDEKILYLAHAKKGKREYIAKYGIDKKEKYDNGDLIVTSRRLLFAQHTYTSISKGFLRSEKQWHHDHYSKPVKMKLSFDEIDFPLPELTYNFFVNSKMFGKYEFELDKGEIIDLKVELEKAIDAYKHAKAMPKPVEVIHKGTVVNVNVNSKGFLLNVEPCPTCGANLYLSQDRKTAYCKYCNKEIPTVEQITES